MGKKPTYNRPAFKDSLELFRAKAKNELPIVWEPELTLESNLEKFIIEKDFKNYEDLHKWSVKNKKAFWKDVVENILHIPFHLKKYF